MKSLFKISALSLLAAAIAGFALPAAAQTNLTSTNAIAATNLTKAVTAKKKATTKDAKKDAKKDAPAKKPVAGPFHGNLAALDKSAKTITVGTRTFQITADTLIFKDGKPATLEDGVVEEPVSGYLKPAADGKLNATKVTFGVKPEAKAAKKAAKKAAPAVEDTKPAK